MKKLRNAISSLFALGLLAASAWGQATVTPNIQLQVPAYQQTNWQVPLDYDLNLLDSILGATQTLPTGATPIILQNANWITANTGATTITNFSGGFPGQTIRLFCGSGDSFTSVANSANVLVASTFSCASTQSITLVLMGSVWTEVGRSGGGSGGGAFVGGLGPSFQDVGGISTPGNPASGNARLYFNTGTGLLACLTSSAGNCLPSGGSGGLSGMTTGQIPVAATSSTITSSIATSGSGSVCLTTSCLMTTPNLGTPSAINLSNATLLPCVALPALTGDATRPSGSCATTVVALRNLALPTLAASTGLFYDTAGALSLQPTLPTAAEPAHTGDVTNSAGSLAMTLATVNSNVGSFTNANITVNAKGLIIAASNGSGGSSGISGLTAGFIPLAGSATTISSNSHMDDGVTTAATVTSSETVAAPSFNASGSNGGIAGTEGTGAALTAGTGVDLLYPDSTSHCWHQNLNNVDKGCIPTLAGVATSVSNSDGTLTISPTTGAVIASLALGHANTWTSTQTFPTPSISSPAFSGTATGTANFLPVTLLNSGTGASSSTFWRGDGTWATPSGGGNVSNSGTPTSGQIAEWTSSTVIQGVTATGTGAPVLATSPTLVTPALGTPSAINLSNATALPCAATPAYTGDTTKSAGSCATTTAKINGTAFPASAAVVGSNSSAQPVSATTTGTGTTIVLSTSPTLVTPALGTPSSGTLTNTTGYPTVHSLGFVSGTPGGSALSTGVLGYMTVPIGCTVTGWSIEADAGTATVKTLKIASGTAIPTLGSNSISTSGVSLSTGTVVQSTTLTDFTTTTVTANDIVAADLITVSGVGYIDFQLKLGCTQ